MTLWQTAHAPAWDGPAGNLAQRPLMICSTALAALSLLVGTQEPPAEAARFYTRYSQVEFSPLFRESLETFVRAEDAYKRGNYSLANRLLVAFWAEHPAGTEAWTAANQDAYRLGRTAGINMGSPTCYYALRMLTECAAWRTSGKTVPADPATATLTVVLVGQAKGIEPRSRAEMESGQGQTVNLRLNDRLLADEHQLIKDSTWLFNEYVLAATDGGLRVKLNYLHLPDLEVPVEVKDRHAGLAGTAWGQIWGAVPEATRRSTDWWWILYPSAVPDRHPDFATTEFITGGMGTGPDGASPCFIIDDEWLTRRPPHLGQGEYTELERRAYLPQWLQHEFFHHLYRIYPEHKLEVEGHDWFNRSTWPADFEGRLEPDYYAESLTRRFKRSTPSLSSRLLYAAPSSEILAKLSAEAMLGEYRHEPEQNGWHRGTIKADSDGRFRWTNAAGATWLLTPDLANGRLNTGPDCPYYSQESGTGQYFTIVLKRDANGKHLPEIAGFNFNGGFYRRL